MKVVFVLLLALMVGALELFLAKGQMKHLVMTYSYDTDLIEPGQNMVMTTTVKNVGRLPVFFAGLSQYITKELDLRESGNVAERTIASRFGENRVNYTLFLLPHRMFTAKVYFSAKERGKYLPGKYFLETGDFLGQRCENREGDLDKPLVVMPERSQDEQAFQTLAGFLGDISVRRFLYEDPVLTIGCRDYTGKEPMKAIAWNHTARTGRMQVHVYDHTVETEATVILNFQGGKPEELEECLRLTRSVCEKLESDRISYEFCTNGDIRTPTDALSWLPSGLGKRHFNAIMYGCGASHLYCGESFEKLAARCARARRSNHGYILITPPLNAEQEAALQSLRDTSDSDVCVLTAKTGGDRT